MGEPLETAIIDGASEIAKPTLLSTLAICIVFVPVFLLQGTAKYLFSSAVAVGCSVAAGEPGAFVHAGAGAVQISDAIVRREARTVGGRFARHRQRTGPESVHWHPLRI